MQTTSIQLHGFPFLVTFDDDGIDSVELELTPEQRLDFTAAEILALEDRAWASIERDPSPVYGDQVHQPRGLVPGQLPAGW